jgi:hypothetical protein
VLCTSTGGALSGLIRAVTDSRFSHAQLVVSEPLDDDLTSFDVLEVGWTIRVTNFARLDRGEFEVWRPVAVPNRENIGDNVRKLVRALRQSGNDRYPWWKLPLYVFPTDWRGRLIRKGMRQVCSVMTARALVSHGWRPRRHPDGVVIDHHNEVEALTPGDLHRMLQLQGAGKLIARATP